MNKNNDYSLGQLFDLHAKGKQQIDSLRSQQKIRELQQTIQKKHLDLKWPVVWDTVIGQIDKLLDIPLSGILLQAWAKKQEIEKYREPGKYPPDETFLVPLLTHTLASTHKPSIEISIGEVFHETIPFTISLKLHLKGFSLEIAGGKIMKIHAGECTATGSVSCMEVTLIKKESAVLKLPEMIDIGEGFNL